MDNLSYNTAEAATSTVGGQVFVLTTTAADTAHYGALRRGAGWVVYAYPPIYFATTLLAKNDILIKWGNYTRLMAASTLIYITAIFVNLFLCSPIRKSWDFFAPGTCPDCQRVYGSVARLVIYLWESGRDPEFSSAYGQGRWSLKQQRKVAEEQHRGLKNDVQLQKRENENAVSNILTAKEKSLDEVQQQSAHERTRNKILDPDGQQKKMDGLELKFDGINTTIVLICLASNMKITTSGDQLPVQHLGEAGGQFSQMRSSYLILRHLLWKTVVDGFFGPSCDGSGTAETTSSLSRFFVLGLFTSSTGWTTSHVL
ncbi:hypothetical protein B0T26DRAFT_676626 [Lasiosphaeria miniovina]|uniref:Uncharacterized protein n=1 Tax=Lasiosphaeria miniovina TaxID=1954250 RepID=A0AA40DYL6_9PEZI|nr:uncharacterized protein B0T26DRAFT_676626 [Lasiosphaeria miniovina]KAK0718462.1 hypothetical protein B0T26DRAFT_676626 [Lasiosphaeria miniovina]